MKKIWIVLIVIILSASSLTGSSALCGEAEGTTRSSSAIHDSGNFTIEIGDDGGATGWDTLEFPKGADRLSSASFGIGTSSNSVDFGSHYEFQTRDPLNITTPGNYTDEEGFCSFTGWPGEDFEGVNITQRTYVNRYRENTRGFTGRWMVLDYEIDTPSSFDSDLFLIQTMNVDLGTSAGDDRFTFLPDINTTVISEATTFVGIGLFDLSGSSHFHGHNAGVYGPGVYSGETEVWNQMSSPNNQSSSVTEQDWYMDLTARIPEEDTNETFHVSFVVMVGNSLFDIRAAYNDAVNGLRGFWTGPWLPNWSRGSLEMEFSYEGPFFPPSSIDLNLSRKDGNGDWEDIGIFHPEMVEGTFNATYFLNTTQYISDWGYISWEISSPSRFGFGDQSDYGEFKVDNKGPDTTIMAINDDPVGTLTVITNAGDRGGSGVYTTFISVDGEFYLPGDQLEIEEDGDDYDFYAYTADNAGNLGPTVSVLDVINDGTPPVINQFTTEPLDIDENTEGPVNVTLRVSDATSGIDPEAVRVKYGVNNPSTEWFNMEQNDENYSYQIDLDWEAVQGNELAIQVMVSDMLGNSRDMTIKEMIESRNDPPEFSISLTGELWSPNDIGISLNGSDPDGDDLAFSFDYKLGNGNWRDIPESSLEQTDPHHYLFDVPKENFEGALYIQCTVDDGTDPVSLPAISRDIDMKPPSLDVDGHPGAGWSTETVELTLNTADGGSGVSVLGFMVEHDGDLEFIPSGNIGLNSDGFYNVTAMTEDSAGNSRTMELDRIRIDQNSPVISNVSIPEMEIGKNLEIGFTIRDDLGFDPIKVGQDPSLYITSFIMAGSSVISTATILPGPGGVFKASFQDPFDREYTGVRIRIVANDEAGNQAEFESDPFNITEEPQEEEAPFEITYPKSAEIGNGFDIDITWEGILILEASYPNTSISWIITAERTSGDQRTYELPAPYSKGEIRFRVLYGQSDPANMTYPEEGWLNIPILGWSDADGDGLSNAFESRYGMDPTVIDDTEDDSDGDGLNLLQEMFNLTDPDEKDSDGDGMNDRWESEKGTLPFRDDRIEDPDGDDWFNFKEYNADTDPRDPEDHPEEPPVTQWYWIVLIVAVLLAIIAYFLWQTVNRRKLEDDLDAMDEEMSWDPPKK